MWYWGAKLIVLLRYSLRLKCCEVRLTGWGTREKNVCLSVVEFWINETARLCSQRDIDIEQTVVWRHDDRVMVRWAVVKGNVHNICGENTRFEPRQCWAGTDGVSGLLLKRITCLSLRS